MSSSSEIAPPIVASRASAVLRSSDVPTGRRPEPPPLPQKAPADDEAKLPLSAWIVEQLPSWLTSIVFHLVLVIVLALIVFKAPIGNGRFGMDFELGGGSGQGGNGRLSESLASSNEIPAESIEALSPTVDAFTQPVVEMPKVDLADVRGRTDVTEAVIKSGRGGDDATGGTGDGDGTGEGSGNSGDGSGYGTASTRTQVFGLKEEGASFVYVFDRSESMNSVLSYTSEGQVVASITPLDAAKAELLRSLEDLTKKQRFQIVFYNHASWLFKSSSTTKNMLSANKDNKGKAAAFVKNMYGEGQTFHAEPLELALSLKPDAIFLLTDGEEKDDPTPDELAKLKKLNNGRTRINVIHFCFVPREDSTLVELAKENRGQHLSFNLSRLRPNPVRNGQVRGGNGQMAPGGRGGKGRVRPGAPVAVADPDPNSFDDDPDPEMDAKDPKMEPADAEMDPKMPADKKPADTAPDTDDPDAP